jgi:hypothetical protein
MPDVDGLDARQFGEGGGPVHVAVAHQDELRVDPLGQERFGEGFVELGHGQGTWVTTWVMGRSGTQHSTLGDGQSIHGKM